MLPASPPGMAHRWGALGIIMMGTFMAILDASIVNVALPHMMSTYSVNRDQIEWVSTGFMLTSAAIMPLIGWLMTRMNYKVLYLGCLGLFTLASGACAMAWNYETMIAARVLQAIGGGAIQPVGMAIVAELFAPHERGRALGIWGTGIMVAPALGPTLGGYLTDAFGWRTIFSVNLPFGILTLLAGLVLMRSIHAGGARRPFDFPGYFFLALALVAGLTALSNGQEKGWDSTYVHVCETLTLIGTVMFIAVELQVAQPLMDLRLFLVRNYVLCVLLAIFRAVGLFGSVFLFPIYLQTLMGYTTIQSGIWMIPGAISVGLTMPIAGRLADRYSPRTLATLGSLLTGYSLIQFGFLDPLSGGWMLILPQVIRGVGLALLMAPLIATALNSVPRHELPMATVFLNVSQNVGGALGIALLNNYVTRAIQQHAVRLGEVLPPQSPEYFRLMHAASALVARGVHGLLPTPEVKTVWTAAQSIFHRAQVLGFDNGFVFGGWIVLAAVPLCLLLKSMPHHRPPRGPAGPPVEVPTD